MRPRHLDHGYLWRRAIARPFARLRHRLQCSLDLRFDVIPVDEGPNGVESCQFPQELLKPRVALAHIGFNRAVDGRWVMEASITVADVQRGRSWFTNITSSHDVRSVPATTR